MNYLKNKLRRKYLPGILGILILIPMFVSAQDTEQIIPDFINGLTILDGGKYIVQNNVKVTQNGLLVIKAGTELLFYPKTSVVVEGGLMIDGDWDKKVIIGSKDKSDEGFGFEISSVDDSKIRIEYANFTQLILPLKFSLNWYRPQVEIENNSFTENRSGESGIIINRPDELLAFSDMVFDFTENVFANNSCNIYIYELESNILKINFTNNVFTGNTYKGFEMGGDNKSPVYAVYNAGGEKYKASFAGNVFLNNFLVNDVSKTILTEVNFGVEGSGDKFSLANNYFGDKSKIDILATFDHFSNNNSSPYLDPSPYLSDPPAHTHTFIWKMEVDKKLFTQNSALPNSTADISFDLYLNKPVSQVQDKIFAKYIYYDNLSFRSKKFLSSDFVFNNTGEKNVISFQLIDSVFLNDRSAYLIIGGIQGADGFIVPQVDAGKNHVFAEIEQSRELAKQKSMYILNMVQHKIDSIKSMPDLTVHQDSALINLSGQLEYINELTVSAMAYDSLIVEMSEQLDSINVATTTGHNIDDLTDRLEHLNSISNQSKRQKKDIRRMNTSLDSLKSESQTDPAQADSIIASLSKRVDDLESYSLSAVFKPISNLWEVGAFVGQSFYTGDLYEGSFNSKYLYLSLGVFARYNFDSHVSAAFDFKTSDIGYAAKDGGSFNARGNVFSLQGEYTFLAEQNILNPYAGTGLSLMLISNQTNAESEETNRTVIALPINLGLKIKAGKNWRLSAGLTLLYPFSDSIDGVSEGGAGDLFYHLGVCASWLIR